MSNETNDVTNPDELLHRIDDAKEQVQDFISSAEEMQRRQQERFGERTLHLDEVIYGEEKLDAQMIARSLGEAGSLLAHFNLTGKVPPKETLQRASSIINQAESDIENLPQIDDAEDDDLDEDFEHDEP